MPSRPNMTAADEAAAMQTVIPSPLWSISVEEQVTKEVRYHIVHSPGGAPVGFYRNLTQAFDYLAEINEEVILLRVGEWLAILNLDFAAQLTQQLGVTDIG